MTEYTVTWKIELNADSPLDAAIEAFNSILDGAKVFEVCAEGDTEPVLVDLADLVE